MTILLDALIRQAYYVPHVAPIWNAVPKERRGKVYVSEVVMAEARQHIEAQWLEPYEDGGECGSARNFILTAGYGDALRPTRQNKERRVILMEHGIGLTFGNAAYADGIGQRTRITHFLVPNQHTLNKLHPNLKDHPAAVIGVPKMDKWANKNSFTMPDKPTIAISFHHGDKNARPGGAGSAWEHYAEVLPVLAARYKLLLHAHPVFRDDSPLKELYKSIMDAKPGTELVDDFEDVLRRADVYLNDASSTMYEFIITGKPVVILNAPWFKKDEQYGIRFWEYADIGEQVDEPSDLLAAMDRAIEHPERHAEQRQQAVRELFPYLGSAAQRAADAILSFMDGTFQPVKPESIQPEVEVTLKPKTILPTVKTKRAVRVSRERGVVYLCFGENAKREMEKSIISLRNAGSTLPVYVIANGTLGLNGLSGEVSDVHVWDGQSPYDGTKANNFQFRAGRVKPSLYQLSPFTESMYVDCDTQFLRDPENGFNFLKHWDFAIAQERLTIGQLYNKRGAGWEHNIAERDLTIQEFGGDGNFPFLNSGVFFWRKNDHVQELFQLWSKEWQRFELWDEQASLMRALNCSSARLMVLSELWNYPHKDNPDAVIMHLYGRGAARENVK